MGIMARILGFVWRRWADYQSVVALADVLDIKTAIGGAFGFLGMTFIGATNMNWSAPTVILAALAAGALVSIIMMSVRMFWRLSPARSVANASSTPSLMADYQSGKWTPSYPLPVGLPDLRVADHKRVAALFESEQRDRLFPLMENETLFVWARPMKGNETKLLPGWRDQFGRLIFYFAYPNRTNGKERKHLSN
jgi:hypothetical protein